MNLKTHTHFKESLTEKEPHSSWPVGLKAMWFDALGNWEASHDIAQDLHTSLGSWIHAYLHRKEGDDWNAKYWYRQANKLFPEVSLEKESEEIVTYILDSYN